MANYLDTPQDLFAPTPTDNGQAAPNGDVSWADYGNAIMAGAKDIPASLYAGAAAVNKAIGNDDIAIDEYMRAKDWRKSEQESVGAMSRTAQERMQSSVLDGKFWSNWGSAIGLKTANMSAPIVASTLPGGLVSKVIGTGAGVATSVGANTVLGAGQYANTVADFVDSASDDQLKSDSTYYRGMRDMMGEADARADFKQYLTTGTGGLVMVGLASAAAGYEGIGGLVAGRGLGKEAIEGAGSRLKSAAIGAESAGAVNAGQAGVAGEETQRAKTEGGFQKGFDHREWLGQVAEAFGVGAIPGAVHGAIAHGSKRQYGKDGKPEATAGSNAEVVSPNGPDQAQRLALTDQRAIPGRGEPGENATYPQGVMYGDAQGNVANSNHSQSREVALSPHQIEDAEFRDVTPPQAPPAPQALRAPPDFVADNTGKVDEGGNRTRALPAPEQGPQPAPRGYVDPNPRPSGPTIPVDSEGRAYSDRQPPDFLGDYEGQVGRIGSDVGKTEPESQASLRQQQRAAADPSNDRKAVLYPKGGHPMENMGLGLKRVDIPDGTILFNPAKVTMNEVRKSAREGRLNELLGLGPVTKAEALSRVGAGEKPAIVTERTPDGTEVKAAAGTDKTAPVQEAALEAKKTPGDTVQRENPEALIAERQAANVTADSKPPLALPKKAEAAKAVSDKRTKSTTDSKAVPNVDSVAKHVEFPEHAPKVANENVEETFSPQQPTLATEGSIAEHERDARRMSNTELKTSLVAEEKNHKAVGYDSGKYDTSKLTAVNRELYRRGIDPQDVLYPDRPQAAKDASKAIMDERGESNKRPSLEVDNTRAKEATTQSNPSPAETKPAPKKAEAAKKTSKAKAVKTDENGDRIPNAGGRTKSEVNARAEYNRIAGEAHSANPHKDTWGEALLSSDPAEQKAAKADMLARAQALIDHATDADIHKHSLATEGGKRTGELESRFRDNADTSRRLNVSSMLLHEAKRLLSGRKDRDAFLDFIYKSTAAHNGDWEGMVRDRIEGGDAVKKVDQGDSGQGSAEPSVGHTAVGGIADSMRDAAEKASSHDHVRTKTELKKEAESRKAEEDKFAATKSEHTIAAEKAAEKYDAVAAKIDAAASADNVASYVAGKNATDVKVETKRKFRINPTPNGKAMLERAEARGIKFLEGEDYGSEHEIHTDGNTIEAVETHKLGDVLDKRKFKAPGMMGALMPLIAKRVKELVGHVDVHVLSKEEMARLTGKSNVFGAFDHDDVGRPFIAVVEGMHDAQYNHTLLHEAIHAATAHAIEGIKPLKEIIRRIMNEVLNYGGGDLEKETHYSTKPKYLMEHYAFQDEHEFISEAMSNTHLQELMSDIDISPELARDLGLQNWTKATLWSKFVDTVRKALKLRPNTFTALEAAMSTFERLTWASDRGAMRDYQDRVSGSARYRTFTDEASKVADHPEAATHSILSRLTDAIRDIKQSTSPITEPVGRAFRSAFQSSEEIRKAKEHLFGALDEANPLRRWQEVAEKIGVYARKLRDEVSPIAYDFFRLQHKYAGPAWDNFANLALEATRLNVHPDVGLDHSKNAHIGLSKAAKGSEVAGDMKNWQARSKHAELADKFNALPEDLKTIWARSQEVFADRQQQMQEHTVRNIVTDLSKSKYGLPPKVAGGEAKMSVGELVHKVLNGGLEDHQLEHLEKAGAVGKALANADELNLRKGPYFPMMRRGDFVTTASYKINLPKGARFVDHAGDATGKSNIVEFSGPDARERAHEFVKGLDLPSKVRTAYYDPTTGKKSTKLGALSTEGDAEKRYHVHVNNDLVEFHKSKQAAEAAHAEYKANPSLEDVKDVDMKRNSADNVEYRLLPQQVKALVDAIKTGDYSEQTKAMLEKHIVESSIALRQGNRVESRHLPRKGVKGASTELANSFRDYVESSGQYIARTKFAKEFEQAHSEVKEHVEGNRYDGDTLERREVLNTLETRFMGDLHNTATSPLVQNLLTYSFLARMTQPAHLVLHMAHVPMFSHGVLAARYGSAAMSQLLRAYKDMGAFTPASNALREGGFLRKAGQRFKDPGVDGTDFVKGYKAQLRKAKDGAQIVKMLNELSETGHIHPESGYEFDRMANPMNVFTGTLHRLDAGFRELTNYTESVNRVVHAVAAYRLAMEGTGDHAKAVRYAKDTLAEAQGLFSATNNPMAFKGNLAKAVTQFKQFPRLIANMLIRGVAEAYSGESPQVRKEAAMKVAYIVGTAMAMSGVVGGLPWEIVKIPLMAANALGVPDTDFEEWENKLKRGLAQSLGPTMGDIVANGLSHALGPFSVDVHHRMGLSSLLMFGQPANESPDSTFTYMAKLFGGSLPGVGLDGLHSLQALEKGEYIAAAKKFPWPIKSISDSFKAAQYATQGKPTPKGELGMAPVSPLEAATQAIGFKPATVQNYDFARHASQAELKHMNSERTELMKAYGEAKTVGDRLKVQNKVKQYNAKFPENAIDTGALQKAIRRNADERVLGQRVTERNEKVLRGYAHDYRQ